jgi:hypothetical protein
VRTALQSSSANRPRGAIEGIDIKGGRLADLCRAAA